MTHDHYKLFHFTYAQPQNAISLLLSILPPAVARAIDWASLRLLPGSSVDEALQSRHSDLLFSVNLHGRKVLLYVLFEHKSGDDHFTAFQLVRYVVRTYDRFLEENPGATSLPPIVPIVVHHGEQGWQAPRELRDLIDLGSLPSEIREFLAPLQPNLRFLIDDLATVPEAELRERTGTVMHRLTHLLLQFVRPATERDPVEFVLRWHDLMLALWNHPDGRKSIYALFSYLASQLEAPPERLAAAGALIHEEVRTMGKSIAEQCREEGLKKGLSIADQCREEGLRRGKAEGKAEGRAELLLRQIKARFGSAPGEAERRIRAASTDLLDAWGVRILTAARLEDLFA